MSDCHFISRDANVWENPSDHLKSIPCPLVFPARDLPFLLFWCCRSSEVNDGMGLRSSRENGTVRDSETKGGKGWRIVSIWRGHVSQELLEGGNSN